MTDAVLLTTARELGLQRASSRDADVRRLQPRRVRRGVYCFEPGRLPTLVEAAVAALLVLPNGSAAAGLTAARVWQLEGLPPAPVPDEPLEFVVPAPRNGAKLAGAVLRFGEVAERDFPQGIPSTTLARTIVEVIARLDFVDGVVVVESALRRDPSLHTDLRAEQATKPARCGTGKVARVLAFADSLSESVLESRSRVLWHDSGLPAPRQQAVVRRDRAFIARVDFLWEDARLVVEVDGMSKYAEPGALRDEKRRQNELVALGYTVLRFSWADIVGRPAQVVAQVREAMIKRK